MLRLAAEDLTVAPDHQLVAPSLVRSEALSHLYRAVRAGELDEDEARIRLDRITAMKLRLLGDRVSRATAWRIAQQLGWDDTPAAEYLAVAKLQADVLVALDARLAAAADGIVPLAPFELLTAQSRG